MNLNNTTKIALIIFGIMGTGYFSNILIEKYEHDKVKSKHDIQSCYYSAYLRNCVDLPCDKTWMKRTMDSCSKH